ncbi:MAG TPA: DUF2970 domain-containing protein [Hydrogenophaga sp.]|uniref:DUF2970 domain-containing protein n=1 Tax=Hydrogenophaga sp. TaxID=1904254 RepID=UPI002C54B20B|nr:DUF2970 domain-containing protein [Hydrogenophaga sp.]HMN94441.1 DUF2970 domain-containing protein [Hydrogenophaga sp.]HMP09363.1 DUF2970 domain-containing protein [Hydrogenophaga sp.]
MNAPSPRRPGSLMATVRAVLWGFLGVRRNTDYQQDIVRLNPLHLMAVGVVMAFLFVIGLMLVVNWVVA